MKTVVLDRDGVINQNSPDYIKSPDEWHAIPGSLEAIVELNKHGIQVFIATNQSGIARGFYDHVGLDAIHHKMLTQLAEKGGQIERIFYCPHGPDEQCQCRKPKPGLLKQIEEAYPVEWSTTPFVGDSFKDIAAGQAMGARPVLVKTGNGEETLAQYPQLAGKIVVANNLWDAVQLLLNTSNISDIGQSHG